MHLQNRRMTVVFQVNILIMQNKTRIQLFWKQRMIFFAEKEHLTKPSRGIFLSDKITDHGKYIDNREN